jgi:hypothetical protein
MNANESALSEYLGFDPKETLVMATSGNSAVCLQGKGSY